MEQEQPSFHFLENIGYEPFLHQNWKSWSVEREINASSIAASCIILWNHYIFDSKFVAKAENTAITSTVSVWVKPVVKEVFRPSTYCKSVPNLGTEPTSRGHQRPQGVHEAFSGSFLKDLSYRQVSQLALPWFSYSRTSEFFEWQHGCKT